MLRKDYYTLDELCNGGLLSKEDIRYLIENDKTKLAFYRRFDQVIIGGWNRNGNFVGYGTVSYDGPVLISKQHSLTILNHGDASLTTFSLAFPNKAKNWSGDYKLDLAPPNNYLEKWHPVPLDKIDWPHLPAKVVPHKSKTLLQMTAEMLSKIESIKKQEVMSEDKVSPEIAKIMGDHPKEKLEAYGIKFEVEDACILREDLESLGVIDSSAQVEQAKQKDRSTSKSSDFHDLLLQILLSNNEMSAKEVWKTLELEVARDEGSREFDKHNILIDVSGSEICWESRHGNRQHFQFASLGPTLSKIRKRI